MASSIESLDKKPRIRELEVQKNTDGTVDVVVYWNKFGHNWSNYNARAARGRPEDFPDVGYKDTSNKRWLRRQLKRIVENIEIDVRIGQLDLFTDTTTITFQNAEDASVAVLSLN